MNNQAMTSDDVLDLPPGFRFHPTDEEVVTHYLTPKVLDPCFITTAIAEVDLHKCEPWDMPSRAKIGEKDWYFFCQKDRKYPTGTRTNRATKAGYWKATGKDKEIYTGRKTLVGMRKTLVFYKGRAPKGEKTNWVMHEFRLEGQFHYRNLPRVNKDDWVVCRVFNKSAGGIINNNSNHNWRPEGTDSAVAFIDELLENSSPPPHLVDPSNISCCNYSSKWDGDDLVEGNHQDDGCLSCSVDVLTSAGYLPRPLGPSHNPFGNSGYSLHRLMDGQFLEALEHEPRPSLSEQCKGMRFSSAKPSLITLSRDKAGFDGGKGTGTDENNEISSAMTTRKGSDEGRCDEGGYYGYLESCLMDAADDYDLTLKSLMNQENPSFLPIKN